MQKLGANDAEGHEQTAKMKPAQTVPYLHIDAATQEVKLRAAQDDQVHSGKCDKR